MVNLSKSKYVLLWSCPKLLWLNKYKPEDAAVDETGIQRMETGNDIGDLAKNIFGDYVEVTAKNRDKIDIPKMIEKTQEELAKGTKVICEASFSFNGLYCAVDILKKENDNYDIYEVKSSTTVKDIYLADVAYQKYVLTNCGIKIGKVYIVTLNNEYIRCGELDVKELFKIHDVTDDIKNEEAIVPSNIKLAEKILNSDEEPKYDIRERCGDVNCAYWEYCTKKISRPSIFDIYHLRFSKKCEYYHKGIVTFEDINNNNIELNEMQLRQVDYELNNKEPYIDKNGIKNFLDSLYYPLYFLDFETMMPAIPEFDGTKPYQQIPFQYSLHYIESEDGELKHKEFLAESGKNPLRNIAENLCNDIPKDVCVTAYNMTFEKNRINELANMFPDLKEHLINIYDHLRDFLDPFKAGYYYKKEMGSSFSIKSVLPALYPDDQSLDYHSLEDVHNGGEAMTIFPQIQYMGKEEQERIRKNLLNYCRLDTYAMVKVWEALKEAVKEKNEL